MKIIAYDRMKPGVTYETIEPYLPEEVANVWRLWKAGIVRENYARADELGVVIVFEVESVEAAQRYTDDFPLTKAGFLEWFFIPVQVPLPIEVLFNSKVDSNEPYDMLVGIVSQIADGARVVACVASVLEAARKAGYRVFFTRHMSLPKEVAGVTQLRTAMEWQRVDTVEKVRPQFLREAPGFPITPEVAPVPTETVIDKITMSAFEGTYLDIALRDCGINSFVIVGIALEVGIEPTVRHAMDLGYIPVLVTDACGYGNWEAAQRSLAALKFAGGSLQTYSAAVIEILGGTPQRAAAD